MSEVVEGWKMVADGFSQRLAAVTPDQWEAESNCSEWNVRELVEHAMDSQRGIPAALGADTSVEVGDDPTAAWAELMTNAEAAFRAEGALEQVVSTPFGERPLGEALGLPTMDLLVHTFDLARSTGGDERLPEPIVAHAFEAMKPMDGMIRGKGMFAAKVDPGEGADLQAQFIAFTGRQP